ncbi:hypothetical protein QBC43DRAFT_355242 [Cladorrhinum sp. PSN259]|nr:hypothetical protein QBC43DRAFT_355242 [Cladorrhinum sp. PSN259]
MPSFCIQNHAADAFRAPICCQTTTKATTEPARMPQALQNSIPAWSELEEGVAGSSNRDENGKENESGKGDNGGQDEPVPAEVEAALNKLDYTLAVFSSLMKQVEHERIDGTGRGPLSTRGTMENQKGDDKDDCEQMALGLSKYLPLLAVDEGVEVVRRIMNWEMRRKKMRLGLSTLLMDELLVHDIARRVWKHKGDKVETEVIKPAYDAAQERQGFQGGCTVADRGL